jgi:hypothetical protein
MSMFKTEKLIPVSVTDLGPVAQDLVDHFKQRDYRVECAQVPGGWEVSIARGGALKAAVGLKSALKIQIEPAATGTMVRAGAGILKKQATATAISVLVYPPLVLAQAWGVIREANLDGEAVKVVELSLHRHQRAGNAADGDADPGDAATPQRTDVPQPSGHSGAAGAGMFCTSCGAEFGESAGFCSGCGQARPS